MRIFCYIYALASVAVAEPMITPRPLRVTDLPVGLTLSSEATVSCPPPLDATLFSSILSDAAKFPVKPIPVDGTISFEFVNGNPDTALKEGYKLEIDGEQVIISAFTAAGQFNGLQSLAQLISSGRQQSSGQILLPGLSIIDSPRFEWRGFMLDESRHFTGEEGVKRLLDGMARYKLNRLHWHLTDSAGWRIEILNYPKLTSVGSKSNESGKLPGDEAQFYTQNQIREIVAYAKARNITIIPEIDMPGHADAAVRAYPEHDGGGYIKKDSGGKDKWPHFTFNPAKKETLDFLDDILTEVAGLFPDAKVIHLGGDEVNFGWGRWTSLPEVKDLMERNNFKGPAEVEGWFNKRMAGTVNRLGFETGGWDEISAQDLPIDKTLVFWWRHDKPNVLKQALSKGFPVVLCPRRPCYFDFVQSDSHRTGRRWDGFNPIEDVYRFPSDLGLSPSDEKKVRGIQACLWTETMISQERRDFMTWPRLIALAESSWTAASRKDYASFESRLPSEYLWLKGQGIGFWDTSSAEAEITDNSK